MQPGSSLRFQLPAMRILENEHMYLSYLMDEWHTIVLQLEADHYKLAEARMAFKKLRTLMVEFIEPLKNHTDKEEAYFFPLLGTYIGYEQGPIMSLEEEHKEIDAYIGHFLHHTLQGMDSFSLAQMKEMARDAGEAFEVLTVHFVKEETVLFPIAEKVMKAIDEEKLYEQLNTLII